MDDAATVRYVHGERLQLLFELQDANKAAQDLTGQTFDWVVRESDQPDAALLLRLTTGVSSPDGALELQSDTGHLLLTVATGKTATLPRSRWGLWSGWGTAAADALARGWLAPERSPQP